MSAPLLAAAAAVVCLAASIPAQGPLVPTLPWPLHDAGPFTPKSQDWSNGQVGVAHPTQPTTLNVNHFGVVWYPGTETGEILPPSVAPYPLVVFAHGRFHTAPFIGQNHKQATYLLQHLASWGFVVASVNLDVVGQFSVPAAIPQRGELINKTVEWAMAQPQFQGAVDFGRIVYLGHSRGGEGIYAAVVQNPTWSASIRGLGAIAPTNFQGYSVAKLAYQLYGAQDGDVNNGWPIQLHDQTSTDATKGLRLIEGANHFFFTDSITFAGEGTPAYTRIQHHEIARTYLATLASFASFADRPSYQRLAGDREIEWSAPFEAHRLFNCARKIPIDNFQQAPPDPLVNTMGGANALPGLVAPAEKVLDSSTAASYFHKTTGLAGSWTSPSAYEATLPGDPNMTGWGYVSVNVLQRYLSASNPSGQDQLFRITLVDADGDSASFDNTAVGAWPYPVFVIPNGAPKKSVLKTFRFPMAQFVVQNPALDLSKLRTVRISFDLTPTGEFALDDVSITA